VRLLKSREAVAEAVEMVGGGYGGWQGGDRSLDTIGMGGAVVWTRRLTGGPRLF
jgi:hypothetical protein